MTQAYPLHWPEGWPRTRHPERSRFQVAFDEARQELQWEIERMGGRYAVLSTNVELRRDGNPYASRRDPDDRGVAVYFELNGKQMVFACDRWDQVKDNIRAIEKTIAAMRGIERWGASDMMARAFSAFEALPPPGAKRPWWEVLKLCNGVGLAEAKCRYRALIKRHHPDLGGDSVKFQEIQQAWEEAQRDLAV